MSQLDSQGMLVSQPHTSNSDEELNILVAVRCRGRNDREAKNKSPVIVTIPDSSDPNKESNEVCLNTTDDIGITAQLNSKTYTVDKVFGPNSDQQQVFKDVANPLFMDFLKGYNCTVLVYGMTSTGKTYTMTGDEKLYNGQLSSEAGIIPRVLFKLFDTLEQDNLDYLVKCSFVELYNEELKDLLSDSSSSSSLSSTEMNSRKLKIYDSSLKKSKPTLADHQQQHQLSRTTRSVSLSQPNVSTRIRSTASIKRVPSATLKRSQSGTFSDFKSSTMASSGSARQRSSTNGSNSNRNSGNYESLLSPPPDNNSGIFIQNLQEFEIVNAKQGIKLLQRGLKLRQVASTNMNDFSSRSHSIFTITLYKNFNGELFRVSKMNLVDLAGSENISRSGAINLRAKEAGSINQSLLTLGRVINSLADKSIHVPFRESKLTRLLQDSLGGNTKTALIATISPAKVNSEETASTLEYATKAKNIKNKPQMGSVLIKDILVKNIASELSKLKSDLYNTKSKEGIYMDSEHYDELMRDVENYKTEIQENSRVIENLKQQNNLLLNDKEQLVEKFEKQEKSIKQLTNVIDYVYEKMDKQHRNEENLVDHAKQLVGAVSLMKDSINFYHQAKKTNKDNLSKILNSSLSSLHDQTINQISVLEHQLSTSSSVDENMFEDLKKGFTQTITEMNENTNSLCSTIIDKILNDSKTINGTIEEKLTQLQLSIKDHVANTNTSLSVISDYCNDCNYYLNEKLFNTDNEKIISTHMENAYNELQSNSMKMMKNFQGMVEKYLSVNKQIVSTSLHNVTKEVKQVERANLEPTKKKLSEAIETINGCDALNINFENSYKNSMTEITTTLKKSNESNANVEEYMSSELSKLQEMSTKYINQSPVLSDISNISENFMKQVSTISSSLSSAKNTQQISAHIRKQLIEILNQPDNQQQNHNETLLAKILSDLETKNFKPVESTGKTPLRPRAFQEIAEINKLPTISQNAECTSAAHTNKNGTSTIAKENGSPMAQPLSQKRRSLEDFEDHPSQKKKASL